MSTFGHMQSSEGVLSNAHNSNPLDENEEAPVYVVFRTGGDRMLETGILSEDDRVELIEGEIVHMSPIGSRQVACVNRLNGLLNRKVR